MKILGAGIAVPDGTRDALAYASDYAVKAARLALRQARSLPSELDLIVSLSISPSRLADSPTIAGPRLGHPVQRGLRAANALVFDLLDADWTFALDLAQSHCRQLGCRRALVVRAELLTDVEHAERTGLCDGAGALVIAPGQETRCCASYAELAAPSLASLMAVPARHAHESGFVARAEGSFDPSSGQFAATPGNAGAAVETVIGNVLEGVDAPVTELFCESWVRAWLPFDTWCHSEQRIDVVSGAPDIPAPFQLPAWLAARTNGPLGARRASSVRMALTLDAFKPRLASIAMEI